MRRIIIIAILFFPLIAFGEKPSKNIRVDDIKVIKISAQDERAVIETPERKLQIIKVGDKIGQNAKVTGIAQGRIVLEEVTDRGVETVIIRVGNGKQRVERVSKFVKDRRQLYAPQQAGQPRSPRE